jgi:ribosomal protein S12 methylthiotransferase accessory factor
MGSDPADCPQWTVALAGLIAASPAAAVPVTVRTLGMSDALGALATLAAPAVLDTSATSAGTSTPATTSTTSTGTSAVPGVPAVQGVPAVPGAVAVPGVPEAPAVLGAPAVPVHVYGHQAIVGPVDGPPPGPCPTCLGRRWQALRPEWLRDALELGGATTALGTPPWALPFAADMLAALAAHAGTLPRADPAPLLLLDLETLRVTRTALLADSQCPACGRPVDDSAEAARISARPVPKRAPDDFRVRDLDDYDLPERAMVDPTAGMLGAGVVADLVSRTTSSVSGLFTLRSGRYLRETYWGGHTADYRHSFRVGMLEGLERLAGMRPLGRRTQVLASLDALGDTALDPRTCGLYTPEFHAAEPAVRPFTTDREIPWVWGWSLRDDRPVLVPEVLTYYSADGGLAARFVQETSNGCASGGCLEEAVFFGLMEIVERDAFLLSWYGRADLPEIDVASVRRPATRALIDRMAMIGYTARFFDTRVSFPIPVVTAMAVRDDGGLGALCFGAGAGLDPEDVLAAALSEIATDAPNLRGWAERDHARLRPMVDDFDQVLALHDHPLLYGLPEMRRHADFLLAPRTRKVPLDSLAVPLADDLGEDLRRCVDAVAGRGFDVIAVEQTSPEQAALGLATASVLVPGLVPIDFGWTRQRALSMPRLRTAFREAGRTDRDLTDADLNLAPHPFP